MKLETKAQGLRGSLRILVNKSISQPFDYVRLVLPKACDNCS